MNICMDSHLIHVEIAGQTMTADFCGEIALLAPLEGYPIEGVPAGQQPARIRLQWFIEAGDTYIGCCCALPGAMEGAASIENRMALCSLNERATWEFVFACDYTGGFVREYVAEERAVELYNAFCELVDGLGISAESGLVRYSPRHAGWAAYMCAVWRVDLTAC